MLLKLDKTQYEILFAETWHHKQDLLWMSSVIEYHVYHFVDLSIFIRSIIYIVNQNEAKELTDAQLVLIDENLVHKDYSSSKVN